MLEILLQLQKTLEVSRLIDYIFDNVNDLLLKGSYDEIDKLLQDLLPRLGEYEPDVPLSFLTITLTAYNLLPTRPEFYKEVKADFERRQLEDVDLILKGLETFEPINGRK